MAASHRAPKPQWCLTRLETVNSFENWRRNILYTLRLDPDFAPFLAESFTWTKKTKSSPHRGLISDPPSVAASIRKTAQQKSQLLEVLLSQISRYCPILSRCTIVKDSTSIKSIWQSIRLHYGFQSSIKPDMSQALASLPEDIQFRDDVGTLRSSVTDTPQQSRPQTTPQSRPCGIQPRPLCPLCKTARRPDSHFLSACEYLPDNDKAFMAQARQIIGSDTVDSDTEIPYDDQSDDSPVLDICTSMNRVRIGQSTFLDTLHDNVDSDTDIPYDQLDDSPVLDTCTSINRVQIDQLPFLDAFHSYHSVRLTIACGATDNMIRASTATYLGAKITKSSKSAHRADGHSLLKVIGETRLSFTRDHHTLHFEGLVVENLNSDVLAGIPFMDRNDIAVRPRKRQISIGDFVYTYGTADPVQDRHAVRREHVVRAPPNSTTVWPGDSLEVSTPSDLSQQDQVVAIEPTLNGNLRSWSPPHLTSSVSGTVRIPNPTTDPIAVQRNEHLCNARSTTVANITGPVISTGQLQTTPPREPQPNGARHSDTVWVDPENILPRQMEDSVVRQTSIHDILNGAKIPSASRPAWMSIQSECPDLRRACAHLRQGTRSSKKLTKIRDVKRYLKVATLSKDGLLVVTRTVPFEPSRECIIVPRAVLSGLLSALHIKLDHPSAYQLKSAMLRHFYALDMERSIDDAGNRCRQCTSQRQLPTVAEPQSTDTPPISIGSMFSADVIRRQQQMILVLRESVTSYTVATLIDNERRDTLREALLRLCLDLLPLDGPSAVIRTDRAPDFASLTDDDLLNRHRVTIDLGRAKNVTKNPVAEKALQELELEIRKQDPSCRAVSPLMLSIAVATLNTRVRDRGLSSREMWTQRDRFSNKRIPLDDTGLMLHQHELRSFNHGYSEISKNPHGLQSVGGNIEIGDIVYLRNDGTTQRNRDGYLVVPVDGAWRSTIRKFAGSHLRQSSYRVKTSECFRDRPGELATPHDLVDFDEEDCDPSHAPWPPPPPNIPPDGCHVPSRLEAPMPSYQPDRDALLHGVSDDDAVPHDVSDDDAVPHDVSDDDAVPHVSP